MLKTSIHDADPSDVSTASFECGSLAIVSYNTTEQIFSFNSIDDVEDFCSWLTNEARSYFRDQIMDKEDDQD